jgi:hypothetical protein
MNYDLHSKSVVGAIHYFRGGSFEFGFLIYQSKNILFCNPNFEVKFIKWQANMVAHTLARAAIAWSRRCTYFCTVTFLYFDFGEL